MEDDPISISKPFSNLQPWIQYRLTAKIMMLYLQFFLALLPYTIPVNGVAVAKPAATISSFSTFTNLQCQTIRGESSVRSVQTKTFTETIKPFPFRGTSTCTPVKTITPSSLTSTSTSTVTTTSTFTNTAVTDTFSTTSTYYSTITSTITPLEVTVTFIAAPVTTTTTSTSTIPTSSGFLPVQDTTASAYPGAQKRFVGRSLDAIGALENRSTPSPKGSCGGQTYAQKVTCQSCPNNRIEELLTRLVSRHRLCQYR